MASEWPVGRQGIARSSSWINKDGRLSTLGKRLASRVSSLRWPQVAYSHIRRWWQSAAWYPLSVGFFTDADRSSFGSRALLGSLFSEGHLLRRWFSSGSFIVHRFSCLGRLSSFFGSLFVQYFLFATRALFVVSFSNSADGALGSVGCRGIISVVGSPRGEESVPDPFKYFPDDGWKGKACNSEHLLFLFVSND